ncbi:hypothetical protein SteCoe_8774 [Stentor coeruleus]|uniref:Importin subunit alpha n=1 Tax=Stentor coeruleus TaxID=5963 RepID=A0A1R2CJL6_9CILI|nr:hypothetical protein SteCoe_8774 [Stentor coeruleus]
MEIAINPRLGTFMQTGLPKTIEEFSQFRTIAAVALRRDKRQKHIMHKRMNKRLSSTPTIKISLEEAINQLSLSNLQSIKNFRKLLCQEKFDFLRLVQLKPDIVSYLAKGLESKKTELAFEVSWCFANLACGIPMLVNDVAGYTHVFHDIVVSGENKFLCEQACWVLGNLAADSIAKRDGLRLKFDLLKAMCNLMMLKNSSLSAVSCWAICNIIRSQQPDCRVIIESNGLGTLIELCQKTFSCQVTESLWLLSFITCTYNPNVFIQIYKPELLNTLVTYLNHYDSKSILPVIRIIGNGFLYNQNFDSIFSSSHFSQYTLKLLNNNCSQIKKETLWMLSNLFTLEYTRSFINNIGTDFFKTLNALVTDDNQEIRTEAGIALYNLAEIFSSTYLLTILSYDGPGIINAFTFNISNVPTWVNYGLYVNFDVDLLKCSLGFVILCMGFNELDKETEDVIFGEELKRTIEDCQYTMSKAMCQGNSESYIMEQCNFLLKIMKSDFEFS